MARPMVPNLAGPGGAAEQQTAANRGAAFDVAGANRYGQVGPAGDTNQWVTDPNTGAVTNVTTMGQRPQAMYNALMDNGTNNLQSFQQQYWGGAGGGAPAGGGAASINIQGMPQGNDPNSPVNKGIQKNLDYSHLTAMPGEDIGAARQQAQDALYGRSTGYLDPQWQQQESATRNRLANQGLVPGTPAYDRAYANEQRAKEQAYTGARQDAIAGGGAEAERAQAMALALRNQGVTEAGNLGAFHNAAQQQGAGQYLTQRGQDTALSGQLGAAGISAAASMSNADKANALATRQQQFNELMGMGEGANKYLPQFGISQGNVGAYKPGDIQGATQQQWEDEMARQKAKKPGLFSQLLPIAGTIAGSFAGNPALGSMLGTAAAKGVG